MRVTIEDINGFKVSLKDNILTVSYEGVDGEREYTLIDPGTVEVSDNYITVHAKEACKGETFKYVFKCEDGGFFVGDIYDDSDEHKGDFAMFAFGDDEN